MRLALSLYAESELNETSFSTGSRLTAALVRATAGEIQDVIGFRMVEGSSDGRGISIVGRFHRRRHR